MSLIDPTVPIFGNPTTESVRTNFARAKSELETLETSVAALQVDVTAVEADIVQLSAPALTEYGGINFNGSTDYLDTNPLTGITDTLKGTLAIKLRCADAIPAATQYLFHTTGPRFQVLRAVTTGVLSIAAFTAGGTQIMGRNVGTILLNQAREYTILVSWDLAVVGSAKCWINDIQCTMTGPFFDGSSGNIDYTVAEWALGATVSGILPFAGDIYMVWFDETVALNFDDVAVRRKFFDEAGRTVWLGATGDVPTGTAPILFHAYDDFAEWIYQRGRTTTAWTVNGTPANVAVVDYGYDHYTSRHFAITTATFTVGRTVASIAVNYAGTCTLTLPDAGDWVGREIWIRTLTANAVISNSANVIPSASGTPGTAICAATAGKSVLLKSGGAFWQTVMTN
jgi:hypothetical protein